MATSLAIRDRFSRTSTAREKASSGRAWAACDDGRGQFSLRSASAADVGDLLAPWQEAAESRLRVMGATRIDAMVLDANDLGQDLWRARGYRRQDDWRRWVKGLDRGE